MDTRCTSEDLAGAMDDRDGQRERESGKLVQLAQLDDDFMMIYEYFFSHIYKYIYIYIYVCVCVCVCVDICIYVCANINMCIYTCLYMCVHKYMFGFGLFSLFNGISTFVGYLMSNPFLTNSSGTIQLIARIIRGFILYNLSERERNSTTGVRTRLLQFCSSSL